MKLEVKNIKTFTGTKGYGFECSLYIDGIRAAHVLDAADGGEANFNWLSKEKEREFKVYVDALPNNFFENPEVHAHFPEGVKQDCTSVVCNLIGDVKRAKELKRWCKTKTIFRLPGDQRGSYRLIEERYSAVVKAYLLDTHGKDIEIINEQFLE